MNWTRNWQSALAFALVLPGAAEAQHLSRKVALTEPVATTSSMLERPAKLEVHEVTLEQALVRLFEQSGVPVSFSPSLLPRTTGVSCKCRDLTIRETLDRLLTGTNLTYREIADLVLIVDRTPDPEVVRLPPPVHFASLPRGGRFVQDVRRFRARQGSISGRVLDATTQQPLAGVSVQVIGTELGTLTNAVGSFLLTAVPAGAHQLRASMIGYASSEQSVRVVDGQASTVNFTLQQEAVALEGVVAVGYGTARRGDVTGSIGVVDQENLQSMPLSSPDQALIGQVAGVNVTMPTGLPGGAPQIQVRGVGAVGAGNQPLFVVDGFALPQPDNEAEARFRNPLASIPAEDIESITILKDASATAIYGSRASNGVVIITTKGGEAGAPQITISALSGLQNDIGWTRPDMANARQFVTWQNIRYQDMVARGVLAEIPEPYRNPAAYGEGTDWFDLIRRTAYMHEVQASVSGGSDAVRAFFSAGAQHQQGVVPATDFTRLSLRANIDADLSSRLQAGLRLAPSYTRRNQPQVQEGRNSATGIPMLACPLADAYDEQGNLLPYIDSSEICPGVWTFVNPLYALRNIRDERNRFGALGTGFLQLELGGGLSARTSLNAEWVQSERKFFIPSTIGANNRPPPSVPEGGYGVGTGLNWLSETTLNLATELGPGRLDALAGVTLQEQSDYDASFDGQFPDDQIQTLNVASNIVGLSNEQSWTLLSYLARANYSWRDRFVFTGTVRTDGSSRFGLRNRWGTFPSGAVAWNIHNERFMEALSPTFSELRARVSYGVTGNNQIGNYSHLSVVQQDDYIYGGSVAGGRRVVSLGNEELGWERTNEWNVGVDAAMFDQRLRISAEAYDRVTTDLLVQRILPTSSGFARMTDNLGTVRNRGVEISVNSVNVEGDNFSWSTDFSWALNRNKVISLPGGEPIFSGGWGGQPTHMTAEGQPLGQFIGLVQDGIYQNEQEIAAGPEDPGVIPGNIRWRDLNGDGVIKPGPAPEGDYGVIGNPHPDFTFGIVNSLSVGRFDFRANITGRKGGDIFRFGLYQSAMNVEGVFNVAADYVDNMWLSEARPGNMPTPLGSREAIRRFHVQHSGVVKSGSNVWVRNAMLRYNLRHGFAGLTGASVYLSVQNPLIFTDFRGNPDVQNNQAAGTLNLGVENFAYPIARQFTVGIDLDL